MINEATMCDAGSSLDIDSDRVASLDHHSLAMITASQVVLHAYKARTHKIGE